MKPKKKLKTARSIDQLKKKAKSKRIMSLLETDQNEKAALEHDADMLQDEADQMQRAYSNTINTADRKF